MYRVPIAYHNALARGEVPIPYIVIETHMGFRAYAEKELGDAFSPEAYIADGSYTADGSITAGGDSEAVIEKSGRMIDLWAFERSLQQNEIIGSYNSKTLQTLSVDLDNGDAHFSRLIASEPFIGRTLTFYIGLESLPQSQHLKIFAGTITELNVLEVLTVEASEE